MLICCLYIFFGGVSTQIFCPYFKIFFFSLLSLRVLLYTLDTIPLSDMFCKYFLPVCGLFLHSLNSVFCRAEVFNNNKIQLYNFFSFTDHALVLYLKIHCQIQGHQDFLLCFTFRSVIHFELIFMKGVKSVSRFTYLHVNVQLF